MSYFLPFTTKGKATELQAIEVKRLLGLGPYASLDPTAVLPKIPARLLTNADFSDCAEETRDVLFGPRGHGLSAVGFGRSPADGTWLIFVNPTHHPHRQKASLAEEVVHIVLDHPKTEVSRNGVRGTSRTFNKAVEDEAYCVGAACIMPYRELFNAVHDRHEDVDVIAARYVVSKEYVHYRIRRAGLDRIYKKHHPKDQSWDP